MKAIVILTMVVLTGCTQVIGGPDRMAAHGGHVYVTTEHHKHGEKPASDKPKQPSIKDGHE